MFYLVTLLLEGKDENISTLFRGSYGLRWSFLRPTGPKVPKDPKEGQDHLVTSTQGVRTGPRLVLLCLPLDNEASLGQEARDWVLVPGVLPTSSGV